MPLATLHRELPPAVLLDQTTTLLERQAAMIDALQEAVLRLRAERDEARQIQAKLDAILRVLAASPVVVHAPRVFAPRICRECRSSFLPTGGTQHWCITCRPARTAAERRAWLKQHPRSIKPAV